MLTILPRSKHVECENACDYVFIDETGPRIGCTPLIAGCDQEIQSNETTTAKKNIENTGNPINNLWK